MITDSELDHTITAELRSDPRVHGMDIGVTVRDRVATLTGTVRNFDECQQVEMAAWHVAGVAQVDNQSLNAEVHL